MKYMVIVMPKKRLIVGMPRRCRGIRNTWHALCAELTTKYREAAACDAEQCQREQVGHDGPIGARDSRHDQDEQDRGDHERDRREARHRRCRAFARR